MGVMSHTCIARRKQFARVGGKRLMRAPFFFLGRGGGNDFEYKDQDG